MKKLLRIFSLILIIIILLVGSALGVGFYNPRAYESVINTFVFKKTGYQYVTSDISIQISPTIITIQGLELNNPDWVEDPELLGLGKAVIALDLKQLFNKQRPFWSASLSEVNAQLIENEQGQLNWNTSVLANQPESEVEEPPVFKNLLSFSEINISQAKLRQKKSNVVEEVDIPSLLIQRTSDVAVQVQGTGIYQQQNLAIKASMDIDTRNAAQQILRFAMQAQGLGINLQTKGEVNPLDLDSAKISLKANADNLEQLEVFLATTFPVVTPIDVSLDLVSSKGSYELSKISLLMGGNTLTGDLLYNTKDSLLRVNLASEKLDLGAFVFADKAETEGIQDAEIDWTWMKSLNSEITLDAGEILVNEYVLKDLSAALKLSANSLAIDNLSARYQLQSVEQPEPFFASDLIKITGTAKPLADKTQGNDVYLDINITENNTSLSLLGAANINGITGNELKVKAEASNLDSLARYFQTDFSPYLPAKISANIASSKNQISIEELKFISKESDISGAIEVNWSDEIVSVDGRLVSNLLDLSPIMSAHKDESKGRQKKSKQEKIFSDEAIDWTWLEACNANLDLDINKLIAKENVFNKIETKFEMNNGSLSMQPLQALFAGGSIKSAITLNKFVDSVKLNAQLDAINLGLAAMSVTGDAVLEGGTTDVVLDFNGQGTSLHQIMSSLNGEMIAEVQNGIIKNDAFEMIGTDIVLEILSMLNPFIKEDDTTELECAAIRFTAEEGVFTSNNQLAVETSKMRIVGGGTIAMDTEELEIGFSPSAKKGFGVSLGSLIKFVRLGGTLSNPHPEADPAGLVKSGAAIGAAVSTSGLSLLVEGLFKRATSAGSACNQALKDDIDVQDSDAPAGESALSKESEETE